MPDNNNQNIWPSVVGGLAGSAADTALGMITGRANAQYQQDLAFNTWKKQFDMINEYNKPSSQLRRWSAAGVNPFVNPSGSQMVGQSSSQATPLMGMPSTTPVGSFGTSFSSLMQGLFAAQQAKGKGIENEHLHDWLSAQIREKLSAANHNEILSELDSFMLQLKKEFGRGEAMSKIYGEMSKAYKDYAEALYTKDVKSAESAAAAFRHRAEGVKAYSEAHNNTAVHRQLLTELEYQEEKLQAEIDIKKSEAQENRASAFEAYERGKSETEHRQEMKASAGELDSRSELNKEQKTKIQNENIKMERERESVLKYIENNAEIERKKNNVFSWKFGIELAKAVGAGAIALTGLKKFYPLFRGAKSVKEATDKAGKKNVGDFAAHVAKPTEKGTKLDFTDPKVQKDYPTLYAIWKASQKGGVR